VNEEKNCLKSVKVSSYQSEILLKQVGKLHAMIAKLLLRLAETAGLPLEVAVCRSQI